MKIIHHSVGYVGVLLLLVMLAHAGSALAQGGNPFAPKAVTPPPSASPSSPPPILETATPTVPSLELDSLEDFKVIATVNNNSALLEINEQRFFVWHGQKFYLAGAPIVALIEGDRVRLMQEYMTKNAEGEDVPELEEVFSSTVGSGFSVDEK